MHYYWFDIFKCNTNENSVVQYRKYKTDKSLINSDHASQVHKCTWNDHSAYYNLSGIKIANNTHQVALLIITTMRYHITDLQTRKKRD